MWASLFLCLLPSAGNLPRGGGRGQDWDFSGVGDWKSERGKKTKQKAGFEKKVFLGMIEIYRLRLVVQLRSRVHNGQETIPYPKTERVSLRKIPKSRKNPPSQPPPSVPRIGIQKFLRQKEEFYPKKPTSPHHPRNRESPM